MRHSIYVFFLLACSPFAAATPLRYQFDLAPRFASKHPLYGAQIRIEMTWDPATAAPQVGTDPTFSELSWPASITEGYMSVSGTAALDGTYPAMFHGKWRFFETYEPLQQRLWTPLTTAAIGTDFIGVDPLKFDFRHDGGVAPRPFASTEPFRKFQPYIYMGRQSGTPLGSVSGSAVALPEPTCLVITVLGMGFIAALRRRK